MSGSNTNETTNLPLNQQDKAELLIDISNSMSVVTADPTSPAEGQTWILNNPIISMNGASGPPNGTGQVVIDAQSTNPADFAYFSDTGGDSGNISFDANSTTPTITIFHDANSLHVRGLLGTTTWGDVVSALNAWANTNMSLPTGVTSIISLTDPTHDASVLINEIIWTIPLTPSLAGVPQSSLKYHKDGVTRTMKFPATSLPIYINNDPNYLTTKPGDAWFLYIESIASTALSGSTNDMSMNGYFNVNISSSDPADIAWFTGEH